jgi:hypothetical protein
VIRAELDLPETEEGTQVGGREQGEEMTQTVYAHVNKQKNKTKQICFYLNSLLKL